MEELSPFVYWLPDYGLQRVTDDKRSQDKPSAFEIVRLSMHEDRLERIWPKITRGNAHILAAWVHAGRVTQIQPIQASFDAILECKFFEGKIQLTQDEVPGFLILLAWNKGALVKPDQSGIKDTVQKAVKACALDDAKTLLQLLEAKVSPNAKDPQGCNLVSIAAHTKALSCLKLLADQKADLNNEVNDRAPIERAAEHGDEVVVSFLLERNASPNITDSAGYSPLLKAVLNGHLGTIRLLLARNAKVNQTNKLGQTPLSIAIDESNAEVVEVLLQHNATINATTIQNQLAFLSQCRNGHTRMVQALLSCGSSAKFIDRDQGRHALTEAAYLGSAELAEILLQAGGLSLLNKPNADDYTPLFIACANGNAPFAGALLAAGAKTEIQDKEGNTPLHAAVGRQQASLVNMLLKAGANKDAQNKKQLTALDFALVLGAEDCIRSLVQAGAQLNQSSPSFDSSLEACLKYDDASLLESQLKEGLKSDYKIAGGWPLRRAADIYGAGKCAQMLDSVGATLNEAEPCQIAKASTLDSPLKMLQNSELIDLRSKDEVYPATTIKVRVLVDAEGYGRFSIVENSHDHRLRLGIESMIKNWRFTPPRSKGQPVAVWVRQQLEFPASRKQPYQCSEVDQPPQWTQTHSSNIYKIMNYVGMSGVVTVRLTITEAGTTRDLQVVRSSNAAFNQHFLDTARNWCFTPAIKDGKPVDCIIEKTLGMSVIRR